MNWQYLNISDFSQAEYDAEYKSLSLSRKARVDRLKKADDRKRSLAAGMLLKKTVREKYGIENAVLENLDNGAPVLKGTNLFISLSHCENTVVCAVDEKPIGIDVEKVKPINLSIAKRVCVEEEAFYLFGKIPEKTDYCYCEDEVVLNRFFEIWTAKEAYFKKCGTGITDLKSVNIFSLKRQAFNFDNYYVQIVSD